MALRDRSGFTLGELMVALGLLGLVMAAILGTVVALQRSYVRQRENVKAEDALRVGETTITTILRAAAANPRNITGANIPRLDPGSPPFDSLRVVSDFNPPDSALTGSLEDVQVWVVADTLFVRWRAGGPSAAVAYPVRTLRFEYYDKNGTLLTTAAQVVNATRVKFLMTSPKHSRTPVLTKRETWVTLRNRR